MISAVTVVAASSAAKLVLELDVDTTVPRDGDMMEVEGSEDGVEKEGVASGEGEELEQVIILELGSK